MDKTLVKGLKLIEELATSEGGCGITELAVRLELTKSNVHRLLQTLVACGYVQQAPSGRYAATMRAWEIGYQRWLRSEVHRAAAPYAQDLARRSERLVHLTVADTGQILFVEQMGKPVPHPIHGFWPIGGRLSATELLAGGYDLIAIQIAYLAALDDSQFETAKEDIRQHARSPDHLVDVMRRIEEARAAGYALNRGEWYEDMRGAAAVFRHQDGSIAGVLGFNAWTSDLPMRELEKWALATKQSADLITHALTSRAHR